MIPERSTATLLVTKGLLEGDRYEIHPAGLTIGRDPVVCQIVVSEPPVSRKHAFVHSNGPSVFIKHLSRTNPTYINNVAIRETRLRSGDELRVGESVFVLKID